MASLAAGAWFDKVTDDLAEGVKGIKSELTKGGSKASAAVSASKMKHSSHVYYGYSLITLDGDGGRWTIVKEKESVFAKDLTNYTKVTGNKAKPICLVAAKPASFATRKPEKEDLLVKFGDTVILWTQIGMGRYLRPTLFKGYCIFDQEMPEIGDLNGASCFKLLHPEVPTSTETIKYGDTIELESCKSPGNFISVEEGYVRLVKPVPGKVLPKFTINRHEDKPTGTGPTVQPVAVAGVNEQKNWYASLQEGIKQMMDDDDKDAASAKK